MFNDSQTQRILQQEITDNFWIKKNSFFIFTVCFSFSAKLIFKSDLHKPILLSEPEGKNNFYGNCNDVIFLIFSPLQKLFSAGSNNPFTMYDLKKFNCTLLFCLK